MFQWLNVFDGASPRARTIGNHCTHHVDVEYANADILGSDVQITRHAGS